MPRARTGPAIEGAERIARALSELYGRAISISRHTLRRLATRPAHPLPVDGYAGRIWVDPGALRRWVDEERRRLGYRPAQVVGITTARTRVR